MLVFGDRARTCEPSALIEDLNRALVAAPSQGLARHVALVGTFLTASELAQGVADAELPEMAARTPASDATMDVLHALAAELAMSWTALRAGILPGGSNGIARVRAVLDALGRHALPEAITTRRAEGYAFYAVYPEAYLVAARHAPRKRRHVIGIRSIGAGLAAVVAEVTGAPRPATVRPRGDPLARELVVAPALAAEWTCDPDATIAIVDEGPGLSGSSFGAVVDALEHVGVPIERIECFPSHRGELGAAASARHRARWTRLERHVVDVDGLLIESGMLARWISELVGPIDRSLEDISAGRWRAHRFSDGVWPPSVIFQERRKLLARAGGTTWLARFVGLGRDGERALALARTLYTAGFTPEPAGLCHGFLVERWLGDSRPLDPRHVDRRRLVERVGDYLGFRARALPAGPGDGASLTQLATMVGRNETLALGASAGADVGSLDSMTPRALIDGRLHAWEWQVCAADVLLKTDAVDHHDAHDLIGCQPIEWDVAGAAIELELVAHELARLIAVVGERARRAIDPALFAFLRRAYLAFQLGRHALAIDSVAEAEARRLQAAVARYSSLLREP